MAYLANVINKSTLEINLENMPVVCEFLDVFLEDLVGLPPDRELEFVIELLLGSTPISIPPTI